MKIIFLLFGNLAVAQVLNRDSLMNDLKEEQEESQLMNQEKFLRSEIAKQQEYLKLNPSHILQSRFSIVKSSFYSFTAEQRKDLGIITEMSC